MPTTNDTDASSAPDSEATDSGAGQLTVDPKTTSSNGLPFQGEEYKETNQECSTALGSAWSRVKSAAGSATASTALTALPYVAVATAVGLGIAGGKYWDQMQHEALEAAKRGAPLAMKCFKTTDGAKSFSYCSMANLSTSDSFKSAAEFWRTLMG